MYRSRKGGMEVHTSCASLHIIIIMMSRIVNNEKFRTVQIQQISLYNIYNSQINPLKPDSYCACHMCRTVGEKTEKMVDNIKICSVMDYGSICCVSSEGGARHPHGTVTYCLT
jgi:hypothetical protein